MREIHNLCQSGQTVAVSGVYEMVGAPKPETQRKNTSTVQELHQGEFFPDYDGRAVCWVPAIETLSQKQTARLT